MPYTRTQIVSLAVQILGQKSVANLLNQSDLVNSANIFYDVVVEEALGDHFWRFSTTIVQLNQVLPIPIGGYWFYAYQLPANYLKLIHTWPFMYDFEIYENQLLYSNYNDQFAPLYLEYQFRPADGLFPTYFVVYLFHRIAEMLSLSNAHLVQYKDALKQDTLAILGKALASDAQNRPQTSLVSMPMINRRYVSTFASG